MADMIEVAVTGTADNNDALSGSALDPIPYDGTLELYAASTVADTTLSLTIADEQVKRAQALNLRTNGVPLMSDDPGLAQQVINGVKATVVIDVVTAGTWKLTARLVP